MSICPQKPHVPFIPKGSVSEKWKKSELEPIDPDSRRNVIITWSAGTAESTQNDLDG